MSIDYFECPKCGAPIKPLENEMFQCAHCKTYLIKKIDPTGTPVLLMQTAKTIIDEINVKNDNVKKDLQKRIDDQAELSRLENELRENDHRIKEIQAEEKRLLANRRELLEKINTLRKELSLSTLPVDKVTSEKYEPPKPKPPVREPVHTPAPTTSINSGCGCAALSFVGLSILVWWGGNQLQIGWNQDIIGVLLLVILGISTVVFFKTMNI